MKRWAFVTTAFAMDIAEYMPQLVDPMSHANYGKNALEAMDLLFEREGERKAEFYDAVMHRCCQEMRRPNGEPSQPMSMEDVLCDYIRYIRRYVPKGYDDLELWQVSPNFIDPQLHFEPTHASYKAVVERYEGQAMVEQRERWLDFVGGIRKVYDC